MDTNTGWVKLHREFKNWEWYGDIITRGIFIDLILTVNWEEKKWRGITIPAGSIVTSIEHLAQSTGVSTRVLRERLNKLEKTGEIAKQTSNKFTIITLLNWTKYQDFMETGNLVIQESPNNRQTNGKQTPNNRQQLKKARIKEIKKERKNTLPPSKTAEVVSNESSVYSFSEPEQVSGVQMMDSLERWERILKKWVTAENLYSLKAARDKHFLKFSPTLQEEIVQYVESLPAPHLKHLSNLWLGPLLKQKDFSVEHIRIEVERKIKIEQDQIKKNTGTFLVGTKNF
jgi:hypothetical protein